MSKSGLSVCRASIPGLAAMLLLPSLATAQGSGSDPFEVFPIAVHCELKKTQYVFYLSRVDANGVATYISPSRAAGTITVDGTAQRIGGDQAGSCKGKTLEQLRESKQTLDVSR